MCSKRILGPVQSSKRNPTGGAGNSKVLEWKKGVQKQGGGLSTSAWSSEQVRLVVMAMQAMNEWQGMGKSKAGK